MRGTIIGILIGAAVGVIGYLVWSATPVGDSITEAMAPPKTVTVEITSDPSGARITIDGQNRGTTPAVLSLEQGRTYAYKLTAREPYSDYQLYRPYESTLVADSDKAISVWIDRTTAEEQAEQRAAAERERERRALEACQRRVAAADLILEDWGWRGSSSMYVRADGRVTNNTNRTIEYARVLIEYTTDSGQFITSDWTYLEITALLPRQSTPFSVLTRRNPEMARASVRFLDRDRRELMTIDRKNAQC